MIDWGALLPATPAKVGAGDTASDAGAARGLVADAEIAAREREGDNRRRCAECGNLGGRGL